MFSVAKLAFRAPCSEYDLSDACAKPNTTNLGLLLCDGAHALAQHTYQINTNADRKLGQHPRYCDSTIATQR